MNKAYDFYYNKSDKKYYLVEIEYNLDDGTAKITNNKHFADHLPRAIYEMKKLLSEKETRVIKENK